MSPARNRPDDQALLERERETALLARVITGAAGGAAGLVLIEGPAGIGKTRLLGEGRRLAASSGFAVAIARGSELEREFGFGAVRQLFEPALADPERRAALLAGAAVGASPVFETLAEAARETAEESSFAVLHGLYWLTLQLAADRPLLLAIDDLQWCDVPSLRFFTYLLHRIEGQPLLMLASLRDAEPGTDPGLVAELAADPLSTVITLGSLSEAGTGELIRTKLGSAEPQLVAACHASTGGNPLLLTELLRAMVAESVSADAAGVQAVRELGPRAASRTVLLRLSRLPGGAVALARAVAVLGDGCEPAAAAALAGLDEATAAGMAASLTRAEVLRADLPLGFVHPVIGDTVYHDIPVAERELDHLRAAQQLTAAAASAEQIAAHLLAVSARGDVTAAATLRDAARGAMRKAAPESAVAYLRRALEEVGEDPELLLELGTAEALTNGPAAAEHLAAAHRAISDADARAGIARGLIHVLGFTGRGPEAVELADHAVAELPAAANDAGHAIEALQLHFACIDRRLAQSVAPRLAELASCTLSSSPGDRMLAGITAFHVGQSGGSA